MFKKIMSVALAYVGIIVGAGLSSGQDLMQYFISFGKWGLIGVIVLGILNAIFGRIIVTLGSYYRSNDHSEVLSKISHPITNWILDISLVISCFVIGFVMIAGAGSNLNQQFGLPIWIGALICALLVISVSFLDFEKITNIIGIFTPIVIVMIVIIAGHTLLGQNFDLNQLHHSAVAMESPMPNIWMSVINYFALCVMTGVSMAFVLGGSIIRIGVAEKGGTIGGSIVGFIIALASFVLFTRVDQLSGVDIPMLVLANEVHPWFAFLYAIVVFGLIFNTAFSLYYALAKRLAGESEPRFKLYLIISVTIGFALSFLGFRELVGLMYPALGYIGLVMLLVLSSAWIREKNNVQEEKQLRRRMIKLISKKHKKDQIFTIADKKEYQNLSEESNVQTETIKIDIHDFVQQELSSI
ncbi:Uncharacterized membrane protein YkvI [Streptococcus henryi]|uniref:Uncharacterized membrane protein YkvI n=1 Tax=Streptococcus henryi TaxID=439219 RepID=A0A1G6C8J1_9STRE|nr:membrane protein [Streptococcus henryi]SDB29210.1 Uncharacterized membrane protein YkvI [Streptococcus henryi]